MRDRPAIKPHEVERLKAYTMFTVWAGQPVDTLHAHVLARAYAAAWLAKYGCHPMHVHVFDRLDLVIDFGDPLEAGEPA